MSDKILLRANVEIADQLDRMCHTYVENCGEVDMDDLCWLIDTLHRFNRWAELMPSDSYPAGSRLWKSWAQQMPSPPATPELSTRP